MIEDGTGNSARFCELHSLFIWMTLRVGCCSCALAYTWYVQLEVLGTLLLFSGNHNSLRRC
jgi:hypothetical protein